MNSTDSLPARPGTLAPAAQILRRAADGYRTGQIVWGRDTFIGDGGCRCLVAAICWAADPEDLDNGGNPVWLRVPLRRLVAMTALEAVAEHLSSELGWPLSMDDGEVDLVETVGAWNDEQDAVEKVIGLLVTVAEGVRPAALGGAA